MILPLMQLILLLEQTNNNSSNNCNSNNQIFIVPLDRDFDAQLFLHWTVQYDTIDDLH